VRKYARYFKEGYDAYGIDQVLLESQWTAWQESLGPELGLEGLLDLGDLLFASGKYEEGGLAVRLLKGYKRQFDARSVVRVGRWLEQARNWAHCDIVCGELIAPTLRAGRVSLSGLAEWRHSPHRFKRRGVPVSMLGLLKEPGPTGPLLEFVRPMMLDGERVVHQGLGWFLREAWKVDGEGAEAFLLEWKDSAPRLIFQYATEKMSPADKERFRRAKRGQGA
jgi:3-methyladenine DNA glycosylase AlkD